jgi:integrating conjugative element protein (TIGR03749 family)
MRRLIVTAVLVTSLPAHALEIMHWARLPLPVPLIVGQERAIFVDRNVRVGTPAALGERLSVQSAAGTVYLRAREPMEPTRLQLQDAENGTLILLDISAEPAHAGQTPFEPVRIIVPAAHGTEEAQTNATPPAHETPPAVALTRYAAQSLYAPLRTVEPVPGITRANLPPDLPLENLLPTLPVKARALASWRLGDMWVSAVRLQNSSPRRLELDPRALLGDFVAATFQHASLGPTGTPEDTTAVYLVTRGRALAQSLLPAIGLADPALNLPEPGSRHEE